jgi:ATP-dependent exoDNAse (exonuclease V) beta subunit
MLTRQARSFENGGDQGLRQFVRSLRELEDETPRLAEWSPEEESGDHVRLTTVHMAKGLEFPFVVLANLNATGSTRSDPLLFDRLQHRAEAKLSATDLPAPLKTAGFQEVAARERAKEAAEEKRLLYVAATRARDYLVIGNFAGDKASGHLKPLHTVAGALGDGPFSALPAPILLSAAASVKSVDAAAWCIVDASGLAAVPASSVPRRQRSDPDPWLAGRTQWATAHTARLTLGSQTGGQLSPELVLARGHQGASLESAGADASRLGLVTHAILEEWTWGMPDAALHAMAHELCDRLHCTDLHSEALTLIHRVESVAALRTWLDRATKVRRAVPMQAYLGSRFVHCVQDLLIETSEGIACIDVSIRAPVPSEMPTEQLAQEVRGALLLHAGQKLACVGTIFLGNGVWTELPAAEHRATAFLERLRGVTGNQPER